MGRDHEHHNTKLHEEHSRCGCGHDHGNEDCGCGHGHGHGDCGCGHDHGHEDCGCGHDHGHGDCGCGHDHGHEDLCGCGHDHAHGNRKKTLGFMIAGAVILAAAVIMQHFTKVPEDAVLITYLIAYFVIGQDVIRGMLQRLRTGHVLDEGFLMTVATVGAFCVGEYAEAVAVMLFYKIGALFEDLAVDRSRKSIRALTDIRPEMARVVTDPAGGAGAVCREVAPEKVHTGQIIRVLPGERVPIDGVVTAGESSLDMRSLTGESVPVGIGTGETVLSGAVNLTAAIDLKTARPYGESTVARILEMVEAASDRKAKSENFVRRFAKYYTPAVVGCAALLVLAGGLITGDWTTWVTRGLTFLVISCPCALVISIPLSFYAGIGRASADGILVKGSNFLEALAQTGTMVFDKTGTLTEGNFRVSGIMTAAELSGEMKPGAQDSKTEIPEREPKTEIPEQEPKTEIPASELVSDETEKREILSLAAAVEHDSPHPIARSIIEAYKEAYGEPDEADRPDRIEEIQGFGLRAWKQDKEILAGNARLLEMNGINVPGSGQDETGTSVYVAEGGMLKGVILISDTVKAEAERALDELRKAGVKRFVMLTGDREQTAKQTAQALGITEYHAQLLPAEKVSCMEALTGSGRTEGRTAYVGDGMNDAPVLAGADVGIAMGAAGSDAAIESADVVLMDDSLMHLAEGVKISRATMRVVRQNLIFAIGMKLIVLLLSALGFAGMWWAVFADVGVMVLTVLNAVRILKMKFA